ncbi:MAG TPA: hypothetical protein VL326_02810 [Kofleriaceae bacterium]|jgi:hypothetical protein|nr:hypothetical protein [Kofleriaceae bacterium]
MKHPPQEADIIPGRSVAATGVGVIVAIVLGALAAYGIDACRTHELGYEAAPHESMPAEVNAMETTVFTSEAQGIESHERAEQVLASYGWVDRDKQLVRVPIEVAFELLLARQYDGGGAP